MLRRQFNTSGQAPSSGAQVSPYPGAVVAVRRNLPLLAAFACLLGLVVVGVLALLVPAGHERDAAMLHGFVGLDRPACASRSRSSPTWATRCPTRAPAWCASASRWRAAAAWRALAAAVLLVAHLRDHARSLKHLLAQPRVENWLSPQIAVTSWPSGHSTAAMTLALCAVLVAPPALRAATALLGGAFAVGVGYAVLVLGWHYPSDVLGGFLMAGLWTSLAVAVLHRVEAPEPAWRPAWEPLARSARSPPSSPRWRWGCGRTASRSTRWSARRSSPAR